MRIFLWLVAAVTGALLVIAIAPTPLSGLLLLSLGGLAVPIAVVVFVVSLWAAVRWSVVGSERKRARPIAQGQAVAEVPVPRANVLVPQRVAYASATVLSVAGVIAAVAILVRSFAYGPDSRGAEIIVSFIGFFVSLTFAIGLVWQWRPALVVPSRIRALTGASNGAVFATSVTPSLRETVRGTLSHSPRELYVRVEKSLSLWAELRGSLVQIADIPLSSVASVHPLGLPRSAGVDEAVLEVSHGDATSVIHFRPYVRALDQSRALVRFLSFVKCAIERGPSAIGADSMGDPVSDDTPAGNSTPEAS